MNGVMRMMMGAIPQGAGEGWNLATATYTGNSLSLASFGSGTALATKFGKEGSKLYMFRENSGRMYEFDVAVPWDLSTVTYTSRSWYEGTDIRGMYIQPDGTAVFVTREANHVVQKYTLGTPWQLNQVSFSQNLGYSNPTSVHLSPDGLRLYVTNYLNKQLSQFDLTTPWNITSAALVRVMPLNNFFTMYDLFLRPDGQRIYIMDYGPDILYQYDMSTPWDISTMNTGSPVSQVVQGPAPTSVDFNNTGTKMFITEASGVIYEWALEA